MSAIPPLTLEERWVIVALSTRAGWKQKRIATNIGCAQSEVSSVISKYNQTGDVVDKPRSGRPSLLPIEDKENNIISHTIRTKRKAKAKDIQRAVAEELEITISVRTIRDIRKQLGYRAVHYRRRPVMSENTRRTRYEYALQNLDNEWQDIIFTDECMFCLTDEHETIWKKPEEPPIQKPVVDYPAKFMIWGGIHWRGTTRLCFIDGGVDQHAYQQILQNYIINDDLSDRWKLLQDGAPAHKAHSTLDFAERQGVDLVQNPPSSPDLNPIEKVWNWMKEKINSLSIYPATKEELKQLVQKYWDEIPLHTIRQFIRHNETVVNDIVLAGGAAIAESNRHRKHKLLKVR
jgi:transposase